MSKYRNDLPQLSGEAFATDGGLETTLVLHEGIEPRAAHRRTT